MNTNSDIYDFKIRSFVSKVADVTIETRLDMSKISSTINKRVIKSIRGGISPYSIYSMSGLLYSLACQANGMPAAYCQSARSRYEPMGRSTIMIEDYNREVNTQLLARCKIAMHVENPDKDNSALNSLTNALESYGDGLTTGDCFTSRVWTLGFTMLQNILIEHRPISTSNTDAAVRFIKESKQITMTQEVNHD